MTGITAPATCPDCAADLTMTASGTPGRYTTRALVECTECRHTFVVIVELRPVARPRNPPIPGCQQRARARQEAH